MEIGTNFTISQTAFNLIPVLVIINSFLQPVWVISKSVFFITSPGQYLSRTFIRHYKSEDGEDNAEDDEEEHDDQVEPEQPSHATARAN